MDADLTVAVACAIKNSQIQQKTSLAVAQKTLQTQRQQGEAVVALIQQAEHITTQLDEGRLDVRL